MSSTPFDWLSFPIGHGYTTAYQGPGTDTPHFADDIETPFHTPLTALWSGTVTDAEYKPWGGQVFIRMNNGTVYYYYHLDDINVQPGQQVQPGDLIGLSGGQNSGGDHPVSTQWSTGPHTHIGFFSGWDSGAQSLLGFSPPYGPDITPYLNAVRLQEGLVPAFPAGAASPTNSGAAPQVGNSSNPLAHFAVSAGVFLLALLLAGFGAYVLFSDKIDHVTKKAVELGALA